jgi:hypothetical protein
MNLSEITLITIISLIITFILYFIKIILRSKCYECNFLWGLINIKRDVNCERDIENNKIQHNIIDDDKIDINNIISNVKNNNIIK